MITERDVVNVLLAGIKEYQANNKNRLPKTLKALTVYSWRRGSIPRGLSLCKIAAGLNADIHLTANRCWLQATSKCSKSIISMSVLKFEHEELIYELLARGLCNGKVPSSSFAGDYGLFPVHRLQSASSLPMSQPTIYSCLCLLGLMKGLHIVFNYAGMHVCNLDDFPIVEDRVEEQEPSVITKKCTSCCRVLRLDAFSRSAAGKHKRVSRCRRCISILQRLRDPDVVNATDARTKAKLRRKYAKHREELGIQGYDALNRARALDFINKENADES